MMHRNRSGRFLGRCRSPFSSVSSSPELGSFYCKYCFQEKVKQKEREQLRADIRFFAYGLVISTSLFFASLLI